MGKGIEIVPPNRKSNWEWTIIGDKKIAMGYSSINGMGEVAYKELKTKKVELMSKDDFFNIKWSKFTKTSFESSVKAGLFDDWSQSREQILEWKNIKIKDPKQYDLFSGEVGFAALSTINSFAHTPQEQKYKEFLEVCNLDLRLLKKIMSLKNVLYKETGQIVEPVTNFDDASKLYYFSIEKIEEKTSSKQNIKYYSLTISDGSTIKKVNMWKNMYDKLKSTLKEKSFYTTKFAKQNGFLAFNSAAPFKKILD